MSAWAFDNYVPNRSLTTQAAIAAVMQYGPSASDNVEPPMEYPKLRSKRDMDPQPVALPRWRAMLRRIHLYGEPQQFQDDA